MISARALQPQDRIAHYRIIGPLGAGGMGEVYLAEDQSLERSVALKVLPPELVRSEERVRRFVREAKSASSLNHPNIVTIYEIGHDAIRPAEGAEAASGSVHFISMELVSGDTLSTKIHEEKTDLRTLIGYLAQAAEGLAKAHAAGIVHRDLKPGNIMISKDGYAKVLDFGLAKLTEKQGGDMDLTSGATQIEDGTGVGAIVGTVGYMSPEQVRGGVVDHRSDIFSFGCILYEAATRTKPFVADSSVETMHRILHDKPVPVEEKNKEVPAELRRVIRRCLAKNPDLRFQSAKDLAIELREIVEEYDSLSPSGGSGSGTPALTQPVTGRKRISGAAMVAGSVILGAIIVGGAFLFGRGREGGRGESVQAPRITAVTQRGAINGAALSPDGRTIAYSLILDGERSIRVRQVATGGDVEVLPPPQPVPPTDLVFSPDGDYLFYRSADPDRDGYTAVFEIPTLGGTPRKRVYDVDSRVSFSPDGKQLCFRRGVPHKKQEHLVVFDLQTQKERVLATATLPLVFGQPAWSPDAKRIATIEYRGGEALAASIATYRLEDGRREPLGKHAWWDATDLAWMPDGGSLVASVFDPETFTPNQLWTITFPGGRAERLTQDASGYRAITASSDGSMAAVRTRQEANLWAARASAARGVQQVTFGSDTEGSVGDFDPGPDSTIYFQAARDGTVQIFAVGMNGAGERSLTSGEQVSIAPWFRRGKGLFFLRADKDFILHVWRADPNGENPRQLTTGKGERIVDISPDGSRILFSRDDVQDVLWSVSSEGGEAIRLEPRSSPDAKFSPDGSRILHTLVHEVQGQGAFTRQVIPSAGGAGTMLTSLPTRIFDIMWTPDGRGFTFVNQLGDIRNLYVMPLGGVPRALTQFTDGVMHLHRWSPDGTRIAAKRRVNETDNLWVVDADGGNPIAITDFESGRIQEIRWTEDGSRVLFTYGTATQNVVLIRSAGPEKP